MNIKRFILAVLVAGIVGNALDLVVQGQILTPAIFSKISSIRQDVAPTAYIVGDFFCAFVLAWVMQRIGSAFARGIKGGLTCGFYLGILANFPVFYFIHFMVRDFSMKAALVCAIYQSIWFIVIGGVIGAIMYKPAPAPAKSQPA